MRDHIGRWVRICAVSLVATLVMVSAVMAQGLEKSRVSIGVGGKSLFYYLPLTIAEQKGYFKDEGVEVEILDFPGGAKSLQALIGGSVDLVSGAYEHTVTQQAKGQNIEALVLQGKYAGIVLGMSKAKAAAYKSPADLKDMKIGVTAPGSSTHMFVNILLAKVGLKPDVVSLEKNLETYKHDGIISAAATRNVYRDLKTFDPGVQSASVDLGKTINMAFVQKATQKYR